MKSYKLVLIFLLTSTMVNAQNGKINLNQIEEMRKAFQQDPANTAMLNALTNNSIKEIALNRKNLGGVEHHFKYKVDVNGITDQKSSGRCWLFTSLNVIRPKVIEKYNLSSFEFSENYLFFWDQFEKANLFLEMVVKNAKQPLEGRYNQWLFKSPVGDGGVWNSFTNLVTKYGLVPDEIMPETHNSENTRYMSRLLDRKLREFGLELREMANDKANKEDINKRKIEMLSVVYRMLALNLGEPPVKFQYRFVDKEQKIGDRKTYTPGEFAKELFPDLNYSDYIMIMNDPTREYHKLYEIKNDRNVMEGVNWRYINLPNDELKSYALESIKGNDAMYASCDVGKQLNTDIGLLDVDNYDYESVYRVRFGMNKKERILTYESGSSHGMALVAVDVNNNEYPTKWQFENSWGSNSGHNGYLTFTDAWFNEYMFRVVIHKKYLPEDILKILEEKPIMLPPWDPMFHMDK